MIPRVKIKRQDGQTGVVRPSDVGVLAIIASSATGTVNQPATYTSPEQVETDFGDGRLASFSAHPLGVTGNPIVAVKPTTAQAAAYGAMVVTGGGTSVPTAGATAPLDEWPVILDFVTGGTIGVAGITYGYSLDGGQTFSAAIALGSATSIVIPKTGITVNLGAGTVLAGETVAFATTPATPNTTDLVAALEALRVTKQPWEALVVDSQLSTGSGTIATQLDTWLQSLEAKGVFKHAYMNVRMKQLPAYEGATESEASYATALAAVVGAIDPLRVIVCADGADMVEHFQGVLARRPTALYVASEVMAIPIGQDPAEVAAGPVTNCQIVDSRSNPKYHDEDLYETLDAMGLTTLRGFPGRSGAYITNGRIIAGVNGSDYVFVQQLRVMNRACALAYQLLTDKLSKGVGKNPKPGPNGAIYISEASARSVEEYVNAGLAASELKGQCVGVGIVLSRTDDISSNAGARIGVQLSLEALSYIKEFDANAGFVKSFTVPLAA